MRYTVRDEGSAKKYFTQIPNLIDDLRMSVYAFRLYVHLKRVAQDEGICWQSRDTLAKACNMSNGMVTKAKNELKELNLIRIEKKTNPRGGKKMDVIAIVDVWKENSDRFSTSQHDLARSPHDGSRSPHDIKNNPIRITQEEDSLSDTIKQMLYDWHNLFPKKVKPKPTTHRDKIKTRLENPDFWNDWVRAIEKASHSRYLHSSGWFQFEYTIRNDENIQKIISGVFDGFDNNNGKPKQSVHDDPAYNPPNEEQIAEMRRKLYG